MDQLSDSENNYYLSDSNLDKYYSDYNLIVKKLEDNRKKLDKIEEKIRLKKDFQKEFDDEIGEVKLKDGSVIQNIMKNESKKKLIELVIAGDEKSLDDILSIPNMDINMTLFSENLLMYAIRNMNEKMAEYLIFKGINFNYHKDLMELNEKKKKINQFGYSCRQMAYDYGLYNIVDLIDIFSVNTNEKIRKFLIKRYLSNMNRNSSDSRIFDFLLNKRLDLFQVYKNEIKSEKEDLISQITNENNFYKDIDFIKPNSEISYQQDFNQMLNKNNKWSDSISLSKSNEEKFYNNNFQMERSKNLINKLIRRKENDFEKSDISNKNNILPIYNDYSRINWSNLSNLSKTPKTTMSNNFRFNSSINFYTKKSEIVSPLNNIDKKILSKHLNKFNNFYYIKNLERRGLSKEQVDKYFNSSYKINMYPFDTNETKKK